MTQGSKNAVFPKPQTPLLVKIQLPSECGMESQETWHRASHPLSSFEQLWNSIFSSTFIPGFHSPSPQNSWKGMGQMSHEWLHQLHRGGVGGPAAHRWPLLLGVGAEDMMADRKWRSVYISLMWKTETRVSVSPIISLLFLCKQTDSGFLLEQTVPSTGPDTEHSTEVCWMNLLYLKNEA